MLMIHVSWNIFILAYKQSCNQQAPLPKVENFVLTLFDLNQIWEIVLTQNHYIWGFDATALLYNFY